MWISVYFLAYHYTWEHHFVMILPAFVLLYIRERKPWILALYALVALPTPFFLLDIPGVRMPQPQWSTVASLLYHSSKAVPVAVLFGVLLCRQFRKN